MQLQKIKRYILYTIQSIAAAGVQSGIVACLDGIQETRNRHGSRGLLPIVLDGGGGRQLHQNQFPIVRPSMPMQFVPTTEPPATSNVVAGKRPLAGVGADVPLDVFAALKGLVAAGHGTLKGPGGALVLDGHGQRQLPVVGEDIHGGGTWRSPRAQRPITSGAPQTFTGGWRAVKFAQFRVAGRSECSRLYTLPEEITPNSDIDGVERGQAASERRKDW